MTEQNKGNFLIGDVFKLQTNYLNSISPGQFSSIDGSSRIANYVSELQNNLEKTSNVYEQSKTSSSAVLTEQEKMKEILDNEQERLNRKQQIINNAKTTEERKALFTNTQNQEYTAYTKMLLIFILALVIHILLRWGSSWMGDGKSQGFNTFLVLLHIANFAICGIIILFMYLNIQSRSQINYNRIVLPPPNKDNLETTASSEESSSKSFLTGLGICYEQSCCGPDTVWDSDSATCIANSDDQNQNQNQNQNQTVAPAPAPVKVPSPAPSTSPNVSPDTSESFIDMMASFDEQYMKDLDATGNMYNSSSDAILLKEQHQNARRILNAGVNDANKSYQQTESFIAYNQLYNIQNSLLPCQMDYPYKDSTMAQPNDNLAYAKSYA